MHRSRRRRPSRAWLAAALVLAGCAGATTPPTAPAASAPVPTTASPQPSASTAPEAVHPAPRSAASMTWDPTSGTVLMFGGGGAGHLLGDLSTWDGDHWSGLATDGPSPRDDALLVADPEREVVVLFGGRSGSTVHDDTWIWDGSAWTQAAVPGPPARTHGVAAFDQASKRVLVYGGVGTDDQELHDTWAWDGSSWTKLDDVGIAGQAPNGMAFDPSAGLPLVLAVDLTRPDEHSAYPSSVWGWDGSSWNVLGDAGPSFSPLQSFVETDAHPFLLDGGVVTEQVSLYQWTGDAWTTLATDGPPVRNGQAAAWDPVRDRLVMFGGFVGDSDLGDTWEWDSTTWQQVDP